MTFKLAETAEKRWRRLGQQSVAESRPRCKVHRGSQIGSSSGCRLTPSVTDPAIARSYFICGTRETPLYPEVC
jgi:hypothetical protein